MKGDELKLLKDTLTNILVKNCGDYYTVDTEQAAIEIHNNAVKMCADSAKFKVTETPTMGKSIVMIGGQYVEISKDSILKNLIDES